MSAKARLPDFLVIGAARSGTTSLHRYLGQDPQVFMSEKKEANYFVFFGSDSPFVGPADVRALNPRSVYTREEYEDLFSEAGSALAVGESSPTYLDTPEAAQRIDETLPSVRLIVSLRDPVDRAYSDFKQMRAQGWEPEADFASALDLEEQRLEDGWGPWYGYVRRGLYTDRLAPFRERFSDGRISVVLYDDLASDPTGTVRGLLGFLGLDWSREIDAATAHNSSPKAVRNEGLDRLLKGETTRRIATRLLPAGARRSLRTRVRRINEVDRPIEPQHRARLEEQFAPEISRLEELLGRDLSAWRS